MGKHSMQTRMCSSHTHTNHTQTQERLELLDTLANTRGTSLHNHAAATSWTPGLRTCEDSLTPSAVLRFLQWAPHRPRLLIPPTWDGIQGDALLLPTSSNPTPHFPRDTSKIRTHGHPHLHAHAHTFHVTSPGPRGLDLGEEWPQGSAADPFKDPKRGRGRGRRPPLDRPPAHLLSPAGKKQGRAEAPGGRSWCPSRAQVLLHLQSPPHPCTA